MFDVPTWRLLMLAYILLPTMVGLIGSTPVCFGSSGSIQESTQPASRFIRSAATKFFAGNSEFRFTGTNSYHLPYDDPWIVDSVLETASAMNLTAVRVWGFRDRGSLNDTVPSIATNGGWPGVHFQHWDSSTGRPAYNDGPMGLQRLDYVVYKAQKLGLRLIIVLTDNWPDFGGMDQYLAWYGLQNHADFYVDSRVKLAYKNWAAHLISRTNSLTGVRYGDDPTIAAWELANEPECGPSSGQGGSSCKSATINQWVTEMSAHIKKLDPNHLVSVGDQGFFDRKGARDWAYNGSVGGDFDSLIRINTVDFGTYHLYEYGKSIEWGSQWIRDHTAAAASVGKPVILEEFGVKDTKIRDQAYSTWLDTLHNSGASSFLFWMLAGRFPDGNLYPGDDYTLHHPSTTSAILANAACMLTDRTARSTAPVEGLCREFISMHEITPAKSSGG